MAEKWPEMKYNGHFIRDIHFERVTSGLVQVCWAQVADFLKFSLIFLTFQNPEMAANIISSNPLFAGNQPMQDQMRNMMPAMLQQMQNPAVQGMMTNPESLQVCINKRGYRIFYNSRYQGIVKATVSKVFEDLKFKISEDSDQNWSCPESAQLAVSAKLRQLAGQTQDNFNFGPSLLKF